MPRAPLPPDEEARLAALHALAILDTPRETAFDDLATLAATLLGVPYALVSFMDRERQWVKAGVGNERSEEPRDITFCAHTLLEEDAMVVPDAQSDARFSDLPHVAGEPHIRFYAGAPIRTPDGRAVGTLCVFDRVPRVLTSEQLPTLRALARQAESLLTLRMAVRRLEDAARIERRYAILSERSRDAILFMHPDGRIFDANAAASAMYGYAIEELRGLRIHDLRASDRASTEAVLARMASGGLELETEHLRKDGTAFPVAVSVEAARDDAGEMLVSIVRDLGERRRAEVALRLRDRALAASQNAVVIADALAPDMPIIYANPSFERMTGYAAAEALGRNCRFLQGDERAQPARKEIRDAIAAERECAVVLRNFRKDGTPLWIELHLAPVHDDLGRLTHYIGIQTDVTARIDAEADRAALAELRTQQNALLERELARRADQLVRADRLATLGTLAGGVGHELNNITAILLVSLGFVRERADQGLPPEAEDLENLDRAAEHVRLHASQLLALGRPGPDRSARVDLREVVSATLAMLKLVGRTRSVTVEVVAPATPVPVTVNRTRVEQVIVNLVGNAVDAFVDARADRPRVVRVILEPENDATGRRVRCSVEDNGSGIPADRLAQIFEPYFTTKEPGRGTGLGLGVVRQIVESYGGTLAVESRVGVGTAFRFDLPVQPAEAAPRARDHDA